MASSLKGTTKETLANTVDNVYAVVMQAGELHIEVITTALLYLKENPDTTVAHALNVGLNDWDI